jgi:aspartyl/glutamyl-tRNA(Asn/Gln) amidotransferase C subunit
MSDEITPELFAYLVQLAALELAPEEADYLRRQLNQQLRAIRELDRAARQVDAGLHPGASTAHGVAYPAGRRLALREDLPAGSTLAADVLMAGPETEDGYFVVPEIPNQAL